MQSYANRFSIQVRNTEPEDLLFQMLVTGQHEGRPGLVHGGAIAGLLEFAATRYAENMIGHHDHLTLITMSVDFRRGAAMADLFAKARTCALTRRLLIVDVEAWQEDPKKTVATAHVHLTLGGDPAPAGIAAPAPAR